MPIIAEVPDMCDRLCKQASGKGIRRQTSRHPTRETHQEEYDDKGPWPRSSQH